MAMIVKLFSQHDPVCGHFGMAAIDSLVTWDKMQVHHHYFLCP